ADYAITQAIFDAERLDRFRALYEERYGPLELPILGGVLPIASRRHAEFLHNEVPGIDIPHAIRQGVGKAGERRADGLAGAVNVWEPLISLAAAAAVTERVHLATTILQMPNRNEVLVAKQAAVIDRLSGGRLDLGFGLGWDQNDFKVLGARWPKRGKKLERQIR